MPFVQINPRYRDRLDALNLRAPHDFLSLPVVIVSGHPDRHVGRVMLDAIPAFLKREHRVRWRDRLASTWAGFGFVTKSQREAKTLQALERAGINCPEWIACGEDGRGRAFLLVRALTDAVDLRGFLADLSEVERRSFAQCLGATLARMHAAGFDHPDLYSKHVLVSANGERIYLLDWQRSRRGWVDATRRCRDLAALHATLPAEFASPLTRCECLRAYLRSAHGSPSETILGEVLKRFARAISRRTQRLLHKRHIRAALVAPSSVVQELMWLDGETLCVTPEFLDSLDGSIPDWLRLESVRWQNEATSEAPVELPRGRQAILVRRQEVRPLRWLWMQFRRKPLISPEVRQAGVIFRRQRAGLPAPRLLAFGQRHPVPWRTESFLLTEDGHGGSHER